MGRRCYILGDTVNVAISPELTRKPNFALRRQRIKLGAPVVNDNYHREEFSTAHLRAERIEVLRKLKIDDGLQKYTVTRDGKMYWVLAMPMKTRSDDES